MLLSKIAHDQTLQGFHLRRQTAIPQSGNHLRLYFRKSQWLHNKVSIRRTVEILLTLAHIQVRDDVASYVCCLVLIDARHCSL